MASYDTVNSGHMGHWFQYGGVGLLRCEQLEPPKPNIDLWGLRVSNVKGISSFRTKHLGACSRRQSGTAVETIIKIKMLLSSKKTST